jgi:hypothetical protein
VARAEIGPLAAAVPPVPPAPIPSIASNAQPRSLVPPVAASVPVDAGSSEPLSLSAPMPAVMGYATDTFTPAADPEAPAAVLTRADAGGMFHSLFQTGERREAVSPAIRELWTSPGRATAPDAASPPAVASRDKGAGQGFMLGLFRDSGGK